MFCSKYTIFFLEYQQKGNRKMNELEIKKVPFMGTELMAARDADGQIWAGVSYICRGIGLSEDQKRYQTKFVQSEEVLKEGCVKFDTGVFDPNNATIAIKLDYIPLWLAKISITPTMKEERPELAATLKEYQLKAKDVLAAAFLFQKKKPAKQELNIETEAKLNNSRARMAAEWRKLADMVPVPEYQKICAHYASTALAGKPVLPLPETKEHTYTAEEVGKMLGVSGNKIGRIANKNHLKTPEYGVEVWDKSRSSSKQVPAWRYNQKGIDRIKEILS